MEELRRVLSECLNEGLRQIILSNTREPAVAAKAKIRPVIINGNLKFQETRYQGTKVFHENYSKEEMAERIEKELVSTLCAAPLEWRTSCLIITLS